MDMNLPVTVKPSAFLRALADHLEQLPTSPIVVERLEGMPRVGDPWPEQGGVLVGVIRKPGEEMERAVIVCADKAGDFDDAPWGPYGTEINAKSDHWGEPNTKAMADAGSELAKCVLALEVGGFKDWYIPARQELALCFMHAKDLFQQEWYWSSTQSSSLSAWGQTFTDGYVYYLLKDLYTRVRAVRSLVIR